MVFLPTRRAANASATGNVAACTPLGVECMYFCRPTAIALGLCSASSRQSACCVAACLLVAAVTFHPIKSPRRGNRVHRTETLRRARQSQTGLQQTQPVWQRQRWPQPRAAVRLLRRRRLTSLRSTRQTQDHPAAMRRRCDSDDMLRTSSGAADVCGGQVSGPAHAELPWRWAMRIWRSASL